MTETLTAQQAVGDGQCSGHCLVATPDTRRYCDCTCRGAFHGVLADAQLPERAPVERLCGQSAPHAIPGQQQLDLAVAS